MNLYWAPPGYQSRGIPRWRSLHEILSMVPKQITPPFHPLLVTHSKYRAPLTTFGGHRMDPQGGLSRYTLMGTPWWGPLLGTLCEGHPAGDPVQATPYWGPPPVYTLLVTPY